MKHLRQICLGFFLVLTLSIPAFAGDVQAPAFTDGPTETPGITGEMGTPGITGEILTPGINVILALIY